MRNLDVARFVAECVALHAEAVVFSAGGLFAFYPSEVPYHHVSPVICSRDLLQEVVTEARSKGLRVIASGLSGRPDRETVGQMLHVLCQSCW
jgi:hypothetical protein